MNNIKTEFKITSNSFDCYDWWIEGELEYVKEQGIFDKILCIDSKYNDYNNIFDKYINTREYKKINGIETIIYAKNLSFEFNYYIQETEKRADKIKNWISEHTIQINSTGYSQGDFIQYNVIFKNKRDKEKIEKALSFIKDLFTITECKIALEKREVLEQDGKDFISKWDIIDEEHFLTSNTNNFFTHKEQIEYIEKTVNKFLTKQNITKENLISYNDEFEFYN